MRTPETTPVRNVVFFHGRVSTRAMDRGAAMQRRIDSPEGRAQHGQRFATVGPVFGNRRANKRLDRCTLRGRTKVDTQWKRYCLVHTIEKLAQAGYAA
ncbi:MAG: transposase [Gemmatimonas sp.]|uniref:transposase n=1 Tax=Gemmatimonas sp. TaxID=1962908 RepID=UPI00391F6C8C